jgi:hypothetical protein
LCLLAGLGCGVDEGDFIAGADYEPCMGNVPACNRTAGCILGETKYTQGHFPGMVSFVVTTPADTFVEVSLFFKTRTHPGDDTEITWYEPGCSSSFRWESQGADLFAQAGSDRVFSKEHQLRQAGDHLIEIYSNATTNYFLRVVLTTPK